MSKTPLQFRISSALKNIIGSDLINDDFIAVFELVKNAYDAHAEKVEVIFENIYSENSKIIIKDDGKGMNYDDLINKWLFVAYSAKKEGTEEDSYDYRGKIKVARAYAGAKGIGRFSCDRLGSNLYLETSKDGVEKKVEVLVTNWDMFEGDLKDEFVNVNVLHETITKSSYGVINGTVLEISNLKSTWDREKFLRLKDALAKLINPNTQDSSDSFQIILRVKEEVEQDKKESSYWKKVNGNIQNLIFETLDLKTSKIVSEVLDKNHNQIISSLYEGGKLVYSIVEENPFSELHNVKSEIYFLNRSAKNTFARRMGINLVEYGHIFVYKNGLRIYPYGERGEDPLKMDNRKAQGHSRYLGTREVLGYIAINQQNDNLRETSSRGDGLIKTTAYYEMVEWFYSSIRRLEKYGIEIIDWGNELSKDDYIKLSENSKQIALNNLISNLSRSKKIISFDVSPEIFEILDEKQIGSVKYSLQSITQKIDNDEMSKQEVIENIKIFEKDLQRLKRNKEEAEEEAFDKLIENESLIENLEVEKKRGVFQGALIGNDKERIIGLQHQIYHSSSRINRNIKLLLKQLDPKSLDEKAQKYIKVISLESSKINSIANFITKANFNLKATEIETDLVEFIVGYLNEIYIWDSAVIDTKLNIKLSYPLDLNYNTEIRPLEITTIFDNLISNSEKAGAKNLEIKINEFNGTLRIELTDDGKGISNANLSRVFEMGFTTTDGSGIGLFQVYDLIKNGMKGDITISSVEKKGTTINITL